MAKIKLQQVKSGIKRPKVQKQTLAALGFKRLNQIIEFESTPQILGMLNKVQHMVKIVEG